MPKIIVFSGLDGSGKSTQINIVETYLQNQDKKVFKFWSRGGYSPGFQKLKDILRFILKKNIPKPGKSKLREKSLKNSIVRNLWLYISIFDLILFYAFILRIKYFLGYNIIFDRYILDTEIDFNLAYPKINFNKWFIWKLLKFLSLKPDHHFVLLISVKESLRRSKLKDEPFPDSEEVLTKRLKCYENKFLIEKSMNKIWCEDSINIISKKIIELIIK